MKKMLAKYILSVLALSLSWQTVHAAPIDLKSSTAQSSLEKVFSLAHVVHQNTRTILRGIGSNAGRISLGAGVLVAVGMAYLWYREQNTGSTLHDNAIVGQVEPRDSWNLNTVDTALVKEALRRNTLRVEAPSHEEDPAIPVPVITTVAATCLISGMVYGFAKMCGYIGSKI